MSSMTAKELKEQILSKHLQVEKSATYWLSKIMYMTPFNIIIDQFILITINIIYQVKFYY